MRNNGEQVPKSLLNDDGDPAAPKLKLEMPAGASLLFDIRILHRGTANRSNKRRVGFFIGLACTFPPLLICIYVPGAHSCPADGICGDAMNLGFAGVRVTTVVLVVVDGVREMHLLGPDDALTFLTVHLAARKAARTCSLWTWPWP